MSRWFAVLCALVASGFAGAQTGDDLGSEGERLDAALFSAYNACDLESFGRHLAQDIEFFHDKGGPMTGRQAIVDGVRDNICGKVRRELMSGSLVSYAMDNYGMVQLGEHRFCPVEPGPCTGTARFVHLWRREGTHWQVTRIISYDHQPL